MLQAAGFDRGSTVIMAGFPSSVTVDDCRSFASWFSPVIHVEELSSDSASKQFGVVFATTAHVEPLLKFKEVCYGNETITVRGIDGSDSVWNSVGDMITNTNAAPILQMAQDGINVALQQLSFSWGGYLGA
ncbi:hypothetical protein X943_003523 [Babesia divergens]|uniref:RRM domain-containing protein n=1 Tax=Babesia divergens TaxID=32595 RepID=A0AAD9LL37_BABDI|nr:hypothetical protein X943_003523 [Babesia divergens]